MHRFVDSRIRVLEVVTKSALSPSGLPGLDYALNPYIGCCHGCLYCYAKEYTRFRDVVDNWGYLVVVKRNIADVLLKEVKRFRRGVVGLGTITDGYQPVEAVYKLSRRCIEILAENGFRVSVQTKSSLVLRDIDLFKVYRELIDIGVTITSVYNSSPMRLLEPFSTPPEARIEALRRLSAEGIKTWIFYGPIVPGYNDKLDEIEKIIRIAKETRSIVYFDKLRVKKFMWRSRELAELAKRSIGYDWSTLLNKVFSLCRIYGVECRTGFEPGEEHLESQETLDRYFSKER